MNLHICRHIISILTALPLAAMLLASCGKQSQATGDDTDFEQAVRLLDEELDRRGDYLEAHKQELAAAHKQMGQAKTNGDRAKAVRKLIDNYIFFQADSALSYIECGIDLAMQQGDTVTAHRLQCSQALVYGMSGMPWEGTALLDSLTAHSTSSSQLARIYSTYYDVVDYYYGYRLPPRQLTKLHVFTTSIADSLMKYEQADKQRLLRLNATENSIDENVIRLKRNVRESKNDSERGTYAIVLSNKFQQTNDLVRRDYYWAVSAACYVRACRLDNEGLIRLAARLFEKHDYHRAARYADIAVSQAEFYGSRSRMVELCRLQAQIRTHEAQRSHTQCILLWVLGGCLLIVSSLTLIYYVRVRRKAKQSARMQTESAGRLAGMKTENQGLEARSQAMQEAVAQILSISIDALFELATFRSSVLHRLRIGETKQVQKQLESDSGHAGGGQRLLLHGFDVAFTRLYPTFCHEVNNLLRPEERIVLPEGELMTNELRVLALLRIGISSSQRMATILGISVNTVYFYRNRLKNRALQRDTFEDDMMRIGA